MDDLIKALMILAKYANNDRNPTWCEHDKLHISCDISLEMVSADDVIALDELGIFWSESDDGFVSYRYGSC